MGKMTTGKLNVVRGNKTKTREKALICPMCSKHIKEDENTIPMTGTFRNLNGDQIKLDGEDIHAFHVLSNNPLARKRREKSALNKLINNSKSGI